MLPVVSAVTVVVLESLVEMMVAVVFPTVVVVSGCQIRRIQRPLVGADHIAEGWVGQWVNECSRHRHLDIDKQAGGESAGGRGGDAGEAG